MIRLVSLFIWASLSIGSVASEGCFSNLVWPGLKSEPASGGWNGVGKCFLTLFTPERLTAEHWKIIGKMKKNFEAGDISDLAFTMGGLVFLLVVSILLILVFCAAPCALGAYWCTCKKKCKPKSNAIVIFGGIGCNSLAILTIFLSILFCFLSIGSLTSGIENVGTAFDPLPSFVDSFASTLKEQAKCSSKSLVGSLKGSVDAFPAKISSEIVKIPKLKAVSEIKFTDLKASIEDFITRSKILSADLKAIETNQFVMLVNPIMRALAATRGKIDEVTTELSDTSPNSIKTKLDGVEEKQQKASESEIKNEIKAKTQQLSDQISKVSTEVDKQIDEGFKGVEKIKSKIKSFVDDKIKKNVDIVKEKLGIATALNLVLFPCYLALASAIWSTCQSIKFVQKKKAKPKEKCGLLIPITIGLALAFIPLLVSTTFMMFAGVSNVVCNTVFRDESMGYLPQAMAALELNPELQVAGVNVVLLTALEECKKGTSLISSLKLDDQLDKDMISKKFNLDEKKTEFTNTINGMSFDLPKKEDWLEIKSKMVTIETKKAEANTQIKNLRFQMNGQPQTVLDALSKPVEKLEQFIIDVDTFKGQCDAAIVIGQALIEDDIKTEMVKMMIGDGPAKVGLLKEMMDTINGAYLKIRTEILTTSTSCAFAFAAFQDIGTIVCDQGVSGLFGIYAAIGLGVLAFFSACVGTVLIWHSLRAGKEGPQKKPTDEKSSDVNSKKKKKKDGEEGGDEYEVVETVEIVQVDVANQKAKIGDQADPMKAPSSQPTPPGQAPASTPPVVQAVLTDPAAPGDKTNPSLLPNDEQLAPTSGAGAAPAGLPPVIVNMQMVNMEANKEDKDQSNNSAKQNNSITGAGGETKGDLPGGTQQ